MTASLVSCIVPVHNGERFVAEALDSVLTQSYRPLELVVVDDGSTDGTAAILAGYRESILTVRQPNAGPAAARNRGLERARGEFIAFLDADDLWHSQKLARQMARFQARPELELSVTQFQNLWAPELGDEAARFAGHRLSGPQTGYAPPTVVARRATVERIGGFDQSRRHGEVTEWFLRAAACGAVLELLPEVLLYRRLHRDNMTRREAPAALDAFLVFTKEFLDHRRRGKLPADDPYRLGSQQEPAPGHTAGRPGSERR